MTDIEIARNIKLMKIINIAKKLSIKKDALILYGDYKAKIDVKKIKERKKAGKLILVTAINPTSSGIGKTTVSIGLADAFTLKKKSVCLSLREPSLGPVFGIKGGATGGGYSQVVPMEDINLHFNGDFHAITSANNLLASLIDNHIYQGNQLGIDKVLFNRCLDLNDRALREVTVSQVKGCSERKDKFIITAASEIMAIMCLATNLEDLKTKLGNILIATDKKGKSIYAKDLHAEESMTILLKDAIKPNLVQTLAGTPAIIHCGPFANIAHGCSSIIATKTALNLADYCITEAGFGADLGAEKFFDVKCRVNNLVPACVVLVATIKALKLHGGVDKENLDIENLEAIEKGISNLVAHINFLKDVFKVNLVITLNKFSSDTDNEIALVENAVKETGCEFAINNVWGEGGAGALKLADKVISLCNKKESDFSFCYKLNDSVKLKIEKIAKNIYGAKRVIFTEEATKDLKEIKKLGYEDLPIVMAKTQYSLTDDAKKLGAPKNFEITVKNIEIRSGAGFLVVILGNMLLMPALSKKPAALNMHIDENEKIEGLF